MFDIKENLNTKKKVLFKDIFSNSIDSSIFKLKQSSTFYDIFNDNMKIIGYISILITDKYIYVLDIDLENEEALDYIINQLIITNIDVKVIINSNKEVWVKHNFKLFKDNMYIYIGDYDPCPLII